MYASVTSNLFVNVRAANMLAVKIYGAKVTMLSSWLSSMVRGGEGRMRKKGAGEIGER